MKIQSILDIHMYLVTVFIKIITYYINNNNENNTTYSKQGYSMLLLSTYRVGKKQRIILVYASHILSISCLQ